MDKIKALYDNLQEAIEELNNIDSSNIESESLNAYYDLMFACEDYIKAFKSLEG